MRASSRWLPACLAVGWLVVGVSAAAQELPTEPARVRVRLGPVSLDPRFALRNLGIDTNVFNVPTAPTRDVTVTLGPELGSWLTVARVSMSGVTRLTWDFYRDATSERSVGGGHEERLAVTSRWVTPHLVAGIDRSRQRPNAEIDARVRRRLATLGAGVLAHLTPTLTLDAGVLERTLEFDEVGAEGARLARALNRRERTRALTARLVVTPLTTVSLSASFRRDRFFADTVRNSHSVSITPGIEFKPLALVSGSARVGVRHFAPESSSVPAFTGPVADVSLSYLAREVTRVLFTAARDVDYSFEPTEPYYVSTGGRLALTQGLGSGWDVTGQAGRTSLAYRALAGAGRVDVVSTIGVGLGRRFGADARLGLDVERASRDSSLASRRYAGVRWGGSLTYGF